MPSFTQSALNTEVRTIASGSYTDADFLIVANRAVRDVLSDVDMRSMIRRTPLRPNLLDDIFQYTCPTDLQADKIIDIKPQIRIGRDDYWRLTTPEEFDRIKGNSEENLVAVSTGDFIRRILLSRPIDDKSILIDPLDSVGSWVGFGDGINLRRDSVNYVKGSASIRWDISAAGGTTAGIVNSSLTPFNVTDYLTEGSVFVWVFLPSAVNITNFIIRIGSSAVAFHSITVTTNNEGTSFVGGWNLLRFDFVNRTPTGTPINTACNYVALFMTKATTKISETDYRFDNIVMKIGDHYDVIYYSRFGWQTAGGIYIENATTATDFLNVTTDEYGLIIEKTAEYTEQHLKNKGEAGLHQQEYEQKKMKYVLENPSQALVLIQEYYSL